MTAVRKDGQPGGSQQGSASHQQHGIGQSGDCNMTHRQRSEHHTSLVTRQDRRHRQDQKMGPVGSSNTKEDRFVHRRKVNSLCTATSYGHQGFKNRFGDYYGSCLFSTLTLGVLGEAVTDRPPRPLPRPLEGVAGEAAARPRPRPLAGVLSGSSSEELSSLCRAERGRPLPL